MLPPIGGSMDHTPFECSLCGARGIKLWREYLTQSPLLCAGCFEKVHGRDEFSLVTNAPDERTKWIPAIPSSVPYGPQFLTLGSATKEEIQWWESLPLRA